MSIAAVVDALVEAGATPQMIAAAVRAHEARVEAAKAEKRANDAERQRRSRMSRNVTVTACDTPSPEVSEVSPVPPSNLPNHIPKKTPKGVQKGVSEAGVSILLDLGVEPATLVDWQGVRKAKKAGPITETVANGLIREAKKAGMAAQEAVQMAAERGWQGFSAEWANKARGSPPPHPARPSSGNIFSEIHTRLTRDDPTDQPF